MAKQQLLARGRLKRSLTVILVTIAALGTAPGVQASGTASPALVIGSGARMVVKPATRLTLDCDLRNFGTFTPAAGSRVVVNGFGAPALRGVTQFADLQMDLHGTASLSNNASVNGLLVLTNGKLSLAGHDLTTTAISGGSAASYVATPDTLGRLVRQIGFAEPVNFPVGNSSYNPVTARRASGFGVVRVAVLDDVPAPGLAPGAHLSRAWAIAAPSGATGPLDLTLQWNDGEQGPAYQRTLDPVTGQKAWRWGGASWAPQAGVLTGDNFQFPALAGLSGAAQGLWTLASASWVSGVETGTLPTALQLAPVWPNPVRDGATVRFAMPARGRAKVSLYSVRGERVAVLYDGDGDAGWHSTQVDSRRIASGVYFLRLESDDKVVSKKVMVVR